jgi:RHS repeat-associated protein
LPNGTLNTFTELSKASSGSWSTASTTTNEWRITSIADRFGSSANIAYSSSATYSEIWTITDGPRTTSAYFRSDAALASPSSTYDVTLDHIDVPAFGGGTATYTCSYTGQSMPAGNGNSGGPASVVVSTLTALALPNGASYAMTYETSSTTSPGVLTQLRLPTGGSVQWTYGASDWPEASWEKAKGLLTPVPAVVTARAYGGGSWSYGRFPGAVGCWRTCGTNPQCPYGGNRQLTAWVTAPDGTTSISYFSTFVQGNTGRRGSDACNIESGLWDIGAYGLAFTPSGGSIPPDTQNGYPAPSAALNGTSAALDAPTDLGRYLSTEVRTGFTPPTSDWNGFGRVPNHGTPLRSTWVRYNHDDPTGDLHNLNPRQESALTRFDDDSGCDGALCYSGARSFGFDGFGHFAQSSTLSNFPGSASFRTSYTAYDTASDVTDKWLLGLAGAQCTADESDPRTSAISGCGDLPKALLTTSDFDRTTGALKARRTRNIDLSTGAVDGLHDLLAIFEYDSGDRGLVSREKYYGGDVTPLSSASGFTTSSAADYQIDHTYTFSGGTLTGASSRHNGMTFDDDRVTFDAATGLVSAAYDSAGLATTYAYDSMGRVTAMTPPATQPTTYTYTDTTLPVRVNAETISSGDDSVASEYRFDEWGRLARTKSKMFDGHWSAVVTQYDPLGRRSSVGMPEVLADSVADASHVTSYAYDALGRVSSVTQPDGKQTAFAYTGARTTARTSPVMLAGGESNVTTTQLADHLGRLIVVSEPSGTNGASTSTTYGYDVGDHLTSVTTGVQSRTFVYDGRGLLVSESHPENGTTSYVAPNSDNLPAGYDARGHARRRVQGAVWGPYDVTFAYDADERLIEVDDFDQASSTTPKAREVIETFGYATVNTPDPCTDTSGGACDARNGKLAVAVRHNRNARLGGDVAVTQSYTYAGRGGRVSGCDTTIASSTALTGGTFRTVQTWNTLGLVGSITYPYRCPDAGCTLADNRTLTMTYSNGALDTIAGFVSSTSYQPNGLIDTVTHANGVRERWLPDPHGMARPCAIFGYGAGVTLAANTGGDSPACGHSLTGGTAGAVRYGSGEYTYDGSGNITAVGSIAYKYDAVSRLTSAGSETFAYDVYGNLTNHTGTTIGVNANNNQLTAATYDAAGAVVSLLSGSATHTHTWDALGAMRHWRVARSSTLLQGLSARDSEFLYDADGERVATVDYPAGVDFTASNQPVVTYTLRGFGAELLRSYTEDRRTIDTTASSTWTYNDQIWRGSQLLATVAPDGGTFHHVLNHLGSPAAITDDSLAAAPAFSPFGSGGLTGSLFPLQFTGHERDNAANGESLDYMHARYYSAGWGRFLSVDPSADSMSIGIPQSWNRYAYAANSPLLFIDPDGRTVLINGETDDERQKAFAALKHSLHDNFAASRLMMVKVGDQYEIRVAGSLDDFKGGIDTAFTLGVAIGSSAKIGFGLGPVDAANHGGVTNQVTNRNDSNITIDPSAFPQMLGGLYQTMDTAIQHELGHALGFATQALDDLKVASLAGFGTNEQALHAENMARKAFVKQIELKYGKHSVAARAALRIYRERRQHGGDE